MRGVFFGFTGRGPLAVVVTILSAAGIGYPLQAQEGPGPADLSELCSLSAPELTTGDREQRRAHYERRRRVVHQVHEVKIRGVEEELLDYDRVTGLLSINGFGEFQVDGATPAIRLRNECLVRFEFDDEEQAQDRMAQLSLGTVELHLGFLLPANDDFEREFCAVSEEGTKHLIVDLLYARLVDPLSQQGDLATYQTGLGHERALRQSALVVEAARRSVPEVSVSHFQWRRRGQSWSDGIVEGLVPKEEMPGANRLQEEIERALYPCYVRALSRNASLQGAMVLEVSLGQAGERSLSFILNTMGDGEIAGCVEQRIERVMENEELGQSEGVDAVKATVLMRRVGGE